MPLSKRLETSIVVENKPGAAGVIGADSVAKSPRDGSVVLLTSSTFLTAAATQPRLPYDPIAAFAPIAVVGQNPTLLAVSAALPFKTAKDLLAAARARPDELTYGSAGVGSIGHLVTELLCSAAKVQMRHVPYKGAANAAIDLAGGQIHVMMSSYSTLSAFLKSGKVRALAVTSKQPYPAFPDLPPLISIVPGFSNETWGRGVRARGHVRALRRAPESRAQRHIGLGGNADVARGRWHGGRNDDPCRVRRARQERARAMETDRHRPQDIHRVSGAASADTRTAFDRVMQARAPNTSCGALQVRNAIATFVFTCLVARGRGGAIGIARPVHARFVYAALRDLPSAGNRRRPEGRRSGGVEPARARRDVDDLPQCDRRHPQYRDDGERRSEGPWRQRDQGDRGLHARGCKAFRPVARGCSQL